MKELRDIYTALLIVVMVVCGLMAFTVVVAGTLRFYYGVEREIAAQIGADLFWISLLITSIYCWIKWGR